jgi:subtilisin family serine protease
MDNHGHGTHVAGIIGAVGNNGIGTTGVCWKVKLMAVKVMDATGSGTTAAIIQGIDFAVNNGAKVINMSLGGSVFDTAESNAIANAEANGVLVVVAAGNNNANVDTAGNEMYPCNFTHSNILCVAAVTQNNSLATFSNYGTTSVDVAAPGTNIVSTWPGTHTTISDPLSSGWNFSTTSTNGWGYKTTCVSGSPPGCLVNPFNFNHSTAKYNNNTDDHTWKSFNLSGASNAILNFYLIYDTEITNDKITPMISTTLGDPTSSNTPLDSSFSGTSGGALTPLSYDISAYISATTTIGFNFTSDTSKNNLGSAIGFFNIETLKPNNITYNMISGTSMATPQIAGLAAMLFAYNPNFAYNDVINSIVGGGSTLAVLNGKTKNSKTANAINALNFINKPTGGSAIKGP